jgi:hypothetical protein
MYLYLLIVLFDRDRGFICDHDFICVWALASPEHNHIILSNIYKISIN